jgi:RNA processing factor Prp31
MDNSQHIQKARKSIKERLSVDDLIAKLVKAADDVEKAENILFEGVFDVYFLYFPEAAALLKERESFVAALSDRLERKDVSEKLKITDDSMGYDLAEEDKSLLSLQINELKNLSSVRKLIKERLAEVIRQKYPNLYAVAGESVAARLIMLSRGTRKMIMMPASKIQVLGSETSLFTGGKVRTPKYGVIFKHPFVEKADQSTRGKIAKVVASYILLAVKTDTFLGKDKGDELNNEMKEKINKISDTKQKSRDRSNRTAN